ncbi:MAG TPA: outer membrane beta-barrel protein [Vicinamibacterales bacterium]
MRKRLVFITLAAAVAMAVPHYAAAQDAPAGTVSISYAALKDKDLDDWFGLGWAASVGGSLTRSIEIVGEVGGNYQTVSVPEADTDFKIKMHSFLGGVRFGTHGKVGGFVQALAGGTHVSFGLSSCGNIPVEFCDDVRSQDTSKTFFTLQPGGGVDVAIAKRAALRFQGDYRVVFPDGSDDLLHEFRFAAGVVFGFGSK